MEDAVRDTDTGEPLQSLLVDVSELPLTVVMAMDESVLGNALRRLQAEAQDDADVVAGWGQAP